MASLGQALREEREARNISLEEIASATKIVPRYLEALESDHLDRMPGGFFVKGIIRTYARAIGLDPEEVLGRYKAAGLLSGQEGDLRIPSQPSPAPVPPFEPAPAAPPPALPAELTPTPEAPPPTDEKAAPSLLIEEAPRPKLSPAARKRIIAWVWRTGAALAVIAIGIVIWTSRGPGPAEPRSETAAAQGVPPPAPGSQPSSQPATQPASKPEALPAAEEVWKGVTIEITFRAATWIQVRTDGTLKVDGIFPAGATARAQADEKLLIHTGNAGGFTFRLNGKPAKPLGRSGQVLTDIAITPENFRDFLESPPSDLPTG
jgi:hypothetical protein